MPTLLERALKGERVPIAFLGGHECSFDLEYYDDVSNTAVVAAIRNLLEAPRELLGKTTAYVVQYCRDWRRDIDLTRRMDVWKHVQLGHRFDVFAKEDGVYLSLECNCDWEEEHGLQLVFRDGTEITKVGRFDGDLKTESGDVYDNGYD